ncbi:formyltransferase family protein [Halobacillus halophilus]|uniref:formyltransferase family protein n=1 Tax=Halobacillus halophilus TaxID=1570 RepID=UPI001CD2B03F|nr:formyltransferase family protein [Halobacillus halophilus]MCA1010721.1 hypothetical protein [Halobacillus halophilus]
MELSFYVMNRKGYIVLRDFLKTFDSAKIKFVVTSRDENVVEDYFEDIRSLCESYNIMVYDRKQAKPQCNGYKIAIGWKWMIKDTNKLIVIHDSLLPKYRGFSPLVNMLINGEKELGVTALYASENYDEGNIVMQRALPITYPLKIEEAINNISILYSEVVISIYKVLLDKGNIRSVPQNHNEATYSLWRDEEDYFINWENDACKLKRTVDALSFPFQGAKSYLNGDLIKIEEVEIYQDRIIENRDVGKVVFIEQGFPIVVCGSGLLKVTKAVDSKKKSIFPLKKFKSRFKGV